MTTLESLIRQNRFVYLYSVTVGVPDGGPPTADQPPHFFCQIAPNAIGFLSPHSQFLMPLTREDRLPLLSLAEDIVAQGDQSVGVDTAWHRDMTYVTTQISGPFKGKHSVLAFNHHECFRACSSTSSHAFLTKLLSLLLDRLALPDLAHFCFLVENFSLEVPLPGFETGCLIPCPREPWLARIPVEPGFRIRVGQPPAESWIFHVDPLPGGGVRISLSAEPGGPMMLADVRSSPDGAPVARWSPAQSAEPALSPLRSRKPFEILHANTDCVFLATTREGEVYLQQA